MTNLLGSIDEEHCKDFKRRRLKLLSVLEIFEK